MKLIDVSTKNNQNMFTEVDDEDFELLNQWKWRGKKDGNSFYVYCKSYKLKNKALHRIVIKAKKGEIVDHIDGNTLNNKKSNLRLCSKSQNSMNAKKRSSAKTSKYKCFYWNTERSVFKSFVCRMENRKQKKHYVGTFRNELDAAKAYNKKSKELFGEFARLNIIESGEK